MNGRAFGSRICKTWDPEVTFRIGRPKGFASVSKLSLNHQTLALKTIAMPHIACHVSFVLFPVHWIPSVAAIKRKTTSVREQNLSQFLAPSSEFVSEDVPQIAISAGQTCTPIRSPASNTVLSNSSSFRVSTDTANWSNFRSNKWISFY